MKGTTVYRISFTESILMPLFVVCDSATWSICELTVRYYKARVKAMEHSILSEIDGWWEYLKGFGAKFFKDIDNYQNQ